jgi:hypothetical protein
MLADQQRLDQARRQAHANLLQQAQERVHRTASGLQQPATLPGAPQSGFHSSFLQSAQPQASNPQITAPMLRQLGMGGAAANLWESRHPAAMQGHANIPSWVTNQMASQLHGGEQRANAFEPNGGISEGLAPGGLIHLGQGIFLHPGTGEIHGFGPHGIMPGGGGTPIGPIQPGPVAY